MIYGLFHGFHIYSLETRKLSSPPCSLLFDSVQLLKLVIAHQEFDICSPRIHLDAHFISKSMLKIIVSKFIPKHREQIIKLLVF